MPYDIAISQFPGSGWIRHECCDWLVTTVLEMKYDDRVGKIFRLKYSGQTPITASRNMAVLDARKCGAKYLLMVDADMHPDFYALKGAPAFWHVAWDFLMERRTKEIAYGDEVFAESRARNASAPELAEVCGQQVYDSFPPATIAAPYCGPPPDENCYVFHIVNLESNNPNPDWRLEMIPRQMAAIMTGVQKVDAMPTGLILYDMRVFDMLPMPWFAYEYGDVAQSRKVTTEDVYQTRNANFLGMPQFCAFDCWAGHCKGKTVGKPVIVTRDAVHHSLVEAVHRGADLCDRLLILHEPAPKTTTLEVKDDDQRI